MTGLGKLARGLLGLIVLVMLVVVMNTWWHDYRSAASAAKQEATSTPAPAPVAAVAQQTALVLTDGLNLRDKPDATGATLRGLKHGEKFAVVGQIYAPGKSAPTASPTWLQLKDANGALGWVTNNPQYIRVQK